MPVQKTDKNVRAARSYGMMEAQQESADALEIRDMDPQIAAWAADIAKYDEFVARNEYSETRQEAIRDGDRLLT